MTEYTRNITPIDYSGTPQVPAPAQTLGQDILNVAQTGLQMYSMFENKNREAQANSMVAELSDLEVELTKNGLKRRDVLGRLDARLREIAPNQGSQTYIRQKLAQQRGGFLTNQMVTEDRTQEQNRQNLIEGDFRQAMASFPDFQGSLKRNADGTIDEKEKLRIIETGASRQQMLFESQQEKAQATQRMTQEGNDAIVGAQQFSAAVNKRVGTVFSQMSSSYISVVQGLDVQSTENVQKLEVASANFRNVIGMAEQQIADEFNTASSATTNPRVIELLEKNRDNQLTQMVRIRENLNTSDISVAKRIAGNIQIVEQGLKLQGMQNFPLVSALEQIAPSVGRFVFEAVVNKNPDYFDEAVKQTSMGLARTISEQDGNYEFASQVIDYLDKGDTSKASDVVLSTFYQAAEKTINGPSLTRELSSSELEKVSGGLLGILAEAQATDDPKQIANASKLLASENFKVFMDQLPDERKSAMGRFVSGFSQDVLADTTDGLFKKLNEHNSNIAGVTYDADKGEFVLGETIKEQLPSGGFGFNVTRRNIVKKDVEKANLYLKRIRDNAQYDTTVQDGKTLVDTLMTQSLPSGIKVKGKLSPYEFKQETAVNEVREELRMSNADVIRKLEEQVMSLEERLLKGNN